MDTSKEESEPMEPEIQALQDEASGTVDVDDQDEIEELHNSLKEVVKDPSVKPKLQCLMVDPSFSMVTVQSEDSGIVWETASSRCSTPWASEGSSPSESYSLESSGAQGKITVIMDEDKIVRKRKKSGRSKLGDRFKRPSSRMAAYGTERPAMAEVSVPNVRPENDEPAELKVDKDQELFSLISEGYEILNIVVPSKLPTVDEEEASDLVDNLSYLQDTPKIKSKSKPAPAPAGEDYQSIVEVQQIANGEKEHTDKDEEPLLKHAKKEGPDEDYLDKFKLVDPHAPSELPSTSGVPEDENIIQEPKQVIPKEESKAKPSSSNIEDSFVIITDEEIASEHMDEVFYANIRSMAEVTHKGDDSDGGMTDEPKSLKESGSALFGSQETILIPVYLPEGPPKIIDPVLLEEPRAMSFLYTDLYDEAMRSRRRDDDHSDVESTVSERSYKKRFSDDDEDDEGYLEKFILKDETEAVEAPPEVSDDTVEGERIIWPQTKFELTGCLKRVEEPDDSGGKKTAIAATEDMKENEKPQPVDTEKKEEVRQESVTDVADGSKTEQEKAGESKVCVGNHCEPCDARKMISKSSMLSVIQKDDSSLLLEERTKAVGEIRKDEKAKNSEKEEKEAMEISGTILEESSDLLNEAEQAKSFSPEVVSENIATVVEQPSLEKVKEISEKHSDIKVSEEPVNQTIEAKKSDDVVHEQGIADITGQLEVKEATISEEEPGVYPSKSDIIVIAPEAKNSKVSVTSVEPLRTDSVSHVPDKITRSIEEPKTDTVPQEKEKELPEVEGKDIKQDVTEEEMVTETSLGKKSAAIAEAEMPSAEPPGVEVVTVEDEAVRVEEVTTEDQKERELVEKQGEVPVDKKSVATEKTVKDDHLISVIKDTINATEPQLSMEGPQSEIQEQEGVIQEPAVHLVSQGDSQVSETVEPDKTVETSEGLTEELIEVDKTKDTAEKAEPSGEIASMLQGNTDMISDVHDSKEVVHKQSTSSEKSQAVTVALFPGKIETIEFSIGNREKLAGATEEVNKHVVEQAQEKPRKEAKVPILEVILGKAAPQKATEKQLPTRKTEIPPVEHKDSEETKVTRTAELVTGVQKDTKQDVSLDTVLPQTELESNEQAVQESAADAEKAADLERVEPEVKETQALDKPITEVDFVPGTVNEESKVPAESGGQIAVSQDDSEATVAVSEPERIIASVLAQIPSVETQGPKAVSAETKVSEETVSDVAAEIPPVKTPGLEAMTVENKTVTDVVSEILSVETTSPEVVIEEAKISDQIVDDVTEIPSVEITDMALIVDKVSDVIKTSLPEVETEGLRHDATEQEVVTETLLNKLSAIIVEAEIPSVETPGVDVVTEEGTAVRTPPSAAPALVKVEEVTTEDQKWEPEEEKVEELEGLVLSPLRSFSPQEDLSVLPEPKPFKGPEYRDETAEEFGYEMVTRQEVREYVGAEADVIPKREAEDKCFVEEETSKAFEEEEAAEDVLEADYEFIEESESIVLSEEDQTKMQALDAFCLVCQCPVLMMEEHQNHEICSLDKAYEVLKDRLGSLISTLQERSENIEDMVSEIELAYNSVEEHCKSKEQTMDDQNEEMLKLVMDQYNEMSHTMEEEKKAKLEKLYDQIVSFQESIDSAKETLEKNAKEEEEEEDPLTFVSSSKEINMSLAKALESTTLELGPRGLSVFDDYAKGSGNGQKHRKGIPVPQKPHLQPQEANSATSTSVTVYWRVNEGDIIDCFQVYCMEDPQGAISEEYRVTVKESYCTLEDLDPDKCYKVWVMAVNYTGCSLPSERLSFKTAPSVPVIHPELCTVLWDSATLRWASEQPSSAESFTLEYCRQYACEGEGLRSVSGIRGCEQRVLLQPNENYLFYIKAVNSAGASEQSEATLVSTRGTRFHLLKETAGPALRLSEDKATLLYSQDSFNEMASVNECPAILGELLPLKGYYYWETVVSGCPSYRLGITYSSTPSDSLVGENSTSWCMHCVPTSNSSRFELLHNGVETDIFVVDVPIRVGTLLDFTQGRLVFFNAQSGHLLGSTHHRFTEACHPAFGLESPGCLTIHMLPEVPEFARHC